jgi:peptidoglycan/xylan/chitin deacetylase (PgdA/CDA1 family)
VRFRVAILALLAAMLVMAGCNHDGARPTTATWHAAAAADGHGGGSPVVGRVAGEPSQSSAPSAAPGTSAAPSSSPSAPEATGGPDGSPGPGINLGIKMTGNSTVALTFDDGPSAETPQILALLKQHNIKATFCLIGVNVRAHHDLVQAIVRDGHTLCNHTWRHDLHLGNKSPEAIRADLQATNDEIHKAVPDAPIKYFRHPGGNFTPAAVEVAKELGMTSLSWDVDPSDWNVKKYPPGPVMTDHILWVLRHHIRAGSIVLSHDSGGDRSSTLAAYRELLPELTQRFTFGPLPV